MDDFDTLRHLLDRLEECSKDLGEERANHEATKRALDLSNARRPSATTVVTLVSALADRKFIEAIKCYRDLTDRGLKESKDAIESVTANFAA